MAGGLQPISAGQSALARELLETAKAELGEERFAKFARSVKGKPVKSWLRAYAKAAADDSDGEEENYPRDGAGNIDTAAALRAMG